MSYVEEIGKLLTKAFAGAMEHGAVEKEIKELTFLEIEKAGNNLGLIEATKLRREDALKELAKDFEKKNPESSKRGFPLALFDDAIAAFKAHGLSGKAFKVVGASLLVGLGLSGVVLLWQTYDRPAAFWAKTNLGGARWETNLRRDAMAAQSKKIQATWMHRGQERDAGNIRYYVVEHSWASVYDGGGISFQNLTTNDPNVVSRAPQNSDDGMRIRPFFLPSGDVQVLTDPVTDNQYVLAGTTDNKLILIPKDDYKAAGLPMKADAGPRPPGPGGPQEPPKLLANDVRGPAPGSSATSQNLASARTMLPAPSPSDSDKPAPEQEGGTSGLVSLASVGLALPLTWGVDKLLAKRTAVTIEKSVARLTEKSAVGAAEKFTLGSVLKVGSHDFGFVGDLAGGFAAFIVGWLATGKASAGLGMAADSSDTFTMLKGIKEGNGRDIAGGAGSLIAGGVTMIAFAGAIAAGGWVALAALGVAGIAGYLGKGLVTGVYDTGIVQSAWHSAADAVTGWGGGAHDQTALPAPTRRAGLLGAHGLTAQPAFG